MQEWLNLDVFLVGDVSKLIQDILFRSMIILFDSVYEMGTKVYTEDSGIFMR